MEGFPAAHRGNRGVVALRTTGVTIEGSRNHALLVTQHGRLRIGYDTAMTTGARETERELMKECSSR
jgi:hypothetical protein